MPAANIISAATIVFNDISSTEKLFNLREIIASSCMTDGTDIEDTYEHLVQGCLKSLETPCNQYKSFLTFLNGMYSSCENLENFINKLKHSLNNDPIFILEFSNTICAKMLQEKYSSLEKAIESTIADGSLKIMLDKILANCNSEQDLDSIPQMPSTISKRKPTIFRQYPSISIEQRVLEDKCISDVAEMIIVEMFKLKRPVNKIGEFVLQENASFYERYQNARIMMLEILSNIDSQSNQQNINKIVQKIKLWINDSPILQLCNTTMIQSNWPNLSEENKADFIRRQLALIKDKLAPSSLLRPLITSM